MRGYDGDTQTKNMVMNRFSAQLNYGNRLCWAASFEEAEHVLNIKMSQILHV